ncbi:MAG: hypothetical protein AAF432_11640 [Planctomycetota bacterium]
MSGERVNPREALLIHLHIPKTAGTTLSRLVRLRLLRWPPTHWFDHAIMMGDYNVPWLDQRYAHLDRLSPRRQRRVRFFGSHHFGWGVHERLPSRRPSAYLTMLRDPVARVMSTYSFLRRERRIEPTMSISSFLDQPKPFRTFHVDECQLRFLAGERGEVIDVPPGACTQTMCDVAMERLDSMFFVGIMEAFDASMMRLAAAMQWRSCRYHRAQVTPRPIDIDDDIRERIESANRFDRQLYMHARQIHDASLNAMGDDREQRLEQHQRRVARYSRTLGRAQDALPTIRRGLERMKLMPNGQRYAASAESAMTESSDEAV